MNKKEFLEGMTFLGIAYNKEFNQQEIEVWYEMLGKYSSEEFRNAIKNIVKTETRFPSIATITKEIASQKTKEIPEAEEEWQCVLDAVKRYGTWNETEAMKSLKPYTAKITKYVGFNRICQSTPEEQVWNKKEFIAEYNALKDKITEDLQLEYKTTIMLEEGV